MTKITIEIPCDIYQPDSGLGKYPQCERIEESVIGGGLFATLAFGSDKELLVTLHNGMQLVINKHDLLCTCAAMLIKQEVKR